MKDTTFLIETDHKRVLFHPRKNGEIMACFLDIVKDTHRHKIFKTLVQARAMGRAWCGMSAEVECEPEPLKVVSL